MTSTTFPRLAIGAAVLTSLARPPQQAPVGADSERPAAAQAVLPTTPAPGSERGAAPVVPWGVGERLGYDVKFGPIRAGSAVLDIPEITEVRGREVYHTVFNIKGSALFYHVNDTYESWIDTATLASLRFYQTQQEGGKTRIKHYEIYPERRTYQDGDHPEQPSVAEPLDDGSFFYFVRTLPLRTGEVYELNRYFKADRNPVRVYVLRRERVSVPAGTFNAVVVQPTFKTSGYFGERGHAEVWLSDDADRTVLRIQAALPVGSLVMQLRSRQAGRKVG